jgi:hypothetical protein
MKPLRQSMIVIASPAQPGVAIQLFDHAQDLGLAERLDCVVVTLLAMTGRKP